MSDTPRVDAERIKWGMLCECSDNPIDFARTLERELGEEYKERAEAVQRYERAELVCDQLRADLERLRLTSFSQFSRIEELKIACDQWRTVAELATANPATGLLSATDSNRSCYALQPEQRPPRSHRCRATERNYEPNHD